MNKTAVYSNNLFLLFTLSVFSLISCTSDKTTNEDNVIHLEDIWSTEGSVMLSEIAGSIDYVPLQMTDDQASILPRTSSINIRMTKDHFIIYGRETIVRVFDSQGGFVQAIGARGRGPGEYIDVTRVLLSSDENSLWIFDKNQYKMIHYSLEGRLQKEIKLNIKAAQATIDPEGNLFIMYLEYDQSLMDSSKVQKISPEGKLLEEFSLYKNRRLGPGQTWYLASRLVYRDGALEHFEPPYDTLHRYEQGEWKPKLVIDYGPNIIPFEAYSEFQINDILQDYCFCAALYESDDYLFITGVDRQKGKMILIDKNNLTVRPSDYENKILKYSFKYKGLTNDIDGGMPFWPRSSYKDEYLLCLIDPLLLIDFEPATGSASSFDTEHRKKLDDLLANVDMEWNPIIMRVKLR